jgi:hypothetical protein
MPATIGSAQVEWIEEQRIPVSFSLLTPAPGLAPGGRAGDGASPDGDHWVPTFPRAQYLFAEAEYRRWDPAGPHANQYNESVFDECVRPSHRAPFTAAVMP